MSDFDKVERKEAELLDFAREIGGLSGMSGAYSPRLARYVLERGDGGALEDMRVSELRRLIRDWRAEEGLPE